MSYFLTKFVDSHSSAGAFGAFWCSFNSYYRNTQCTSHTWSPSAKPELSPGLLNTHLAWASLGELCRSTQPGMRWAPTSAKL